MTVEQFRGWCRVQAALFASEGPTATLHRSFAATVRPFDPELAELYVRLAEALEAMRAHVSLKARG